MTTLLIREYRSPYHATPTYFVCTAEPRGSRWPHLYRSDRQAACEEYARAVVATLPWNYELEATT